MQESQCRATAAAICLGRLLAAASRSYIKVPFSRRHCPVQSLVADMFNVSSMALNVSSMDGVLAAVQAIIETEVNLTGGAPSA